MYICIFKLTISLMHVRFKILFVREAYTTAAAVVEHGKDVKEKFEVSVMFIFIALHMGHVF